MKSFVEMYVHIVAWKQKLCKQTPGGRTYFDEPAGNSSMVQQDSTSSSVYVSATYNGGNHNIHKINKNC